MCIRSFIKFVDDTLAYGLDRLGLHWQSSDPNTEDCPNYFIHEYGEAVLLYRNANEYFLWKRVRKYPTKFFLNAETLSGFIQTIATTLYNTETVFCATFQYCVLILDMAVLCCWYGRSDLLDSAIHWTIGWVYGSCNLVVMFKDKDPVLFKDKAWEELQMDGIGIMLKQKNAEIYNRLVHMVEKRRKKLMKKIMKFYRKQRKIQEVRPASPVQYEPLDDGVDVRQLQLTGAIPKRRLQGLGRTAGARNRDHAQAEERGDSQPFRAHDRKAQKEADEDLQEAEKQLGGAIPKQGLGRTAGVRNRDHAQAEERGDSQPLRAHDRKAQKEADEDLQEAAKQLGGAVPQQGLQGLGRTAGARNRDHAQAEERGDSQPFRALDRKAQKEADEDLQEAEKD